MEFDISKKIKKPKKSYFLGCFGVSIVEKEVTKSRSSKKKTKSLLCLSKIIRKNSSSSAKTIPVDISGNSSRELHVVKPEKVKTPVIAGEMNQVPVVKGDSQINIHDQKIINKTKDHKTRDVNHKNNKSLDQLLENVHDHSTYRNEFSRSVTLSRTNNSTKDKHEIKLSHSTSLPPPKRKKQVAASATCKKVNNEKSSSQRQEQHVSSDNLDSIIGMSILMVTLLIMLFWGKACAIVCTCAWFYFLPRFRPENEAIIAGKNDVLDEEDVDVNSDEYKKKVVLEGLLKRNHIRNGVEFL